GDGVAARAAHDAALFQRRPLHRRRSLGRPQGNLGDRSHAGRQGASGRFRYRARKRLLSGTPGRMAEEPVQRRLAAILAGDGVGYSRLMEGDEAGTLAVLKARREEVLDPLIATHRGRIFKLMGDGVLAEFASAVDAVECAVELQAAMAAANARTAGDRQ